MTDSKRPGATAPPPVMDLHNGDSMVQKEFHRIYETMPEGFRAELIGGIVFVCEPLGRPHGSSHLRLSSILDAYRASTPSTEACDSTTVILGEEDEVQPDLFMRILPECGGQSRNTRPRKKKEQQYVEGAPELVVEVAFTSRAIDLHFKKKRYFQAGVKEYLVVCLEPQHIVWFGLSDGKMLEPDESGVFRSAIFPGLWIHEKALFAMDYQVSMDTLARGLASQEHADFVRRLAQS